MSAGKRILVIASLIIFIINISAFADWKENADVIKISCGEDYTLVLTKNQWLWACGDNSWYQLGIGDTTTDQWLLVRVDRGDMNSPSDYLEDISDIDAGWKHSLALDVNSFVWAWGDNDYGQLGVNDKIKRKTPVQVYGGDMGTDYLENIIAIAAGRSGAHSLAVDANSFVWAWGLNDTGQLGNGGEGAEQLTPVQVKGGEMLTTWLKDIIAVSGGEDNSIALDANDFVWTWGLNDYGQLGNGSEDNYSNLPVQVKSGEQDPCNPNSFLQNIIAVDSGWDHLLALEEYDPCLPWDPNGDPNYGLGYVYAWGRNVSGIYSDNGGQLGDGTEDNNSTPVKVLCGDMNTPSGYLQNIMDISAGDSHSMALDMYGNVWTWGDNEYGQLGNGTNDPCTTPVKVVGLDGEGYLKNIVAISAGYWHCVAVDSDGSLWTWGKHDAGSLGLGNVGEDVNTPHRIGVVYNLTQQTCHFGLQPAINDANDNGDIIEAPQGTYFENVDFLTKTITLRSVDPNNWDVVEHTVIQGSGSGGVPAVKFNNNPNSILTGFTITNDDYGIMCDSSSPDISNSVIENCGGHGLYCLDNSTVEVTNCKISGNGADYPEDGVNCSNTEITLSNCLIENNGNRGIYCNNSDLNITNCIIQDNGDDGIYCYGSDVTVNKCLIENNSGDGIYNKGSSSAVITNNIIRKNDDSGITCNLVSSEKMEIKNNWIHHNNYGIYIDDVYPNPATIRNNTIVDNSTCGIRSSYGEEDLIVSNCIVWGSNPLYESDYDVTYSCIQDSYNGDGNIDDDPCFYYPDDPNDYHLGPNSPCIDAGNPSGNYDGETDIDGEDRVMDDHVDMGADEYYWSPADFNLDEIVNFIDYAIFANAWLTTSSDPDYNQDCDLDPDNSIDYYDLAVFCEDWLWIPGWAQAGEMPMGIGGGMGGEGMMMGMGFGVEEGLYPFVPAEQPIDIEQMIWWLDKIWLDEEVRETVDEDDWLEFMESLKDEM